MENFLIQKIKGILNKGLYGFVFTFENIISVNEMKSGADEQQVSALIKYFNLKLPNDYIEFLKYFDGGILFKIEDIAGFQLLGCSDIVKVNKTQNSDYGSDWDDNIILFCSSVGDNEYIGFKITDDFNYKIIDCDLSELPKNWHIIGDTFSEFITKLIDEKGRKFWLN